MMQPDIVKPIRWLVYMMVAFALFVLFFIGDECKCIIQQENEYIQAPHSNFDYRAIINVAGDYGELYGNSMQPTYFEGNTALSKRINPNYKIRPGELLRYINKHNEPVVHRVAATYDDAILMEDNNGRKEMINRSQATHIIIGVLFT